MVNVPGRSKGCSTCRRRKIKCDESFPECLQCVKNGSQCPGPRTGAFFVHALPDRSRRPLVKHSEPQTISRKQQEDYDLILRSPSATSIQQPNRAVIFDQLFVSHFIESFGFKAPTTNTPSPTWLDKLTVFLNFPTPSLVKHSIRAGSMFFYGSLAEDVSIQTEACKWYMRALQGLQDVLSQKTSSFTGDIVCAVVMLTHFENLAGTSTEAWFQHVQGAAMMLESGGAESCREGFLHQLFRHLRLLVFAASIFKNKDHVFSSLRWIETPFEVYPKGPFDLLVDILFSLLPCLTVADELIKSQDGNAERLRMKLNMSIMDIISQLHSWWAQCTAMMNFGELNSKASSNSANYDSDSQALDPNHFPILRHSDMPTAALAALYDAANVIALRLLRLVSRSAYLYEERIQRHAGSILSAKDFIATIPGPVSNRGSIMVGFPHRILCIWGPIPTHGNSSSPSTVPSELFSAVAAYVLHHQKPGCLSQSADDWSMEVSVSSNSQPDTMSLALDRAHLTCT